MAYTWNFGLAIVQCGIKWFTSSYLWNFCTCKFSCTALLFFLKCRTIKYYSSVDVNKCHQSNWQLLQFTKLNLQTLVATFNTSCDLLLLAPLISMSTLHSYHPFAINHIWNILRLGFVDVNHFIPHCTYCNVCLAYSSDTLKCGSDWQ
jgi:hypothetical protein